jgi:hypothetical protein
MNTLARVVSGLAVTLLLGLLFLLTGCGDDNSGQITSPPISVHCQAQTPTGSSDNTVRVQCPPSALTPQAVDP